jgi:hypothetical protein
MERAGPIRKQKIQLVNYKEKNCYDNAKPNRKTQSGLPDRAGLFHIKPEGGVL